MDKQQFQRQQFQQQPRYQPKYINPDKEENSTLTDNLFLLFTEGNYLKIKNFISMNNLIENIKDDNNNTIIHKLIENETLTENQKAELIKLCIDKVDITASNKYDVTPLHLACKIQSKVIVDLLLKNGVEFKSDWNGKSVLHYAINGKETKCIDNNKKVGKIKANKDKIDDNLRQINSYLNELILSNNLSNENFNHLKNYLLNFKDIIPEKYIELEKAINSVMSDILSNPSLTSGEKNTKIMEKILTERDNFAREYSDFLNSDKNINIEINSGNEGYWSATNDDNNKILKNIDILGFISKINGNLDESNFKNQNNMTSILDKIESNYLKFDKYYKDAKLAISNLYFYMVYLENNGRFVGININDIFVLSNNTINNPKIEINVQDNLNPDDIENIKLTYGDFYDLLTERENDYFHDIDINDARKIDEKYIHPHGKPVARDVYDILNRLNEDLNKNPNIKDNILVSNANNYIKVSYTFRNIVIPNNLYLFVLYEYYLVLLGQLKDELSVVFEDINNSILTEQYNYIFDDNIYQFMKIIINISIITKLLHKEKRSIDEKIKIAKIDKQKQNIPEKFINKKLDFWFKEYEKYSSNFIDIPKFYNDIIVNSVDWLNNSLDYIEKKSAYKLLDNYHNANSNSININEINTVLSYKFSRISYPKTLEELNDYFDFNNYSAMKSKLIINFLPELKSPYKTNLYYNTTQILTYGKLVSQNDINFFNATYQINPLLKQGNIEITQHNQTKTYNKSEYIYPILYSSYAKEHIGLLKYFLLQKTLREIIDIVQNPATSPLKNLIKKFEVSIEKYNKTNDHTYILIIIAKYVKNLIDKYISDLIISAINSNILILIKQQNIPLFYKDLLDRFNPNLLSNKVQGYELDLTKIYDNLFKENTLNFRNLSKITQSKLIESPKEKYENKIIKIINDNYQEIKSSQEVCFIYDDDIIQLLAEYGIEINSQDNDGQTPIFYAIAMRNIIGIKKLLDLGASVFIKNISGISPLEYMLKLYKKNLSKEHLNMYVIADKVFENVFTDFKVKYENNLPIFSSIIFKVALHMLNHHFLMLANKYYSDWSFTSFEKLKKIFEDESVFFNSKLPILDIILDENDYANLNVYKTKKEDLENKNTKYNNEILDLQEQIKNLHEEIRNINSKGVPNQYDTMRKEQIRNLIRDLRIKLRQLNRDEQNTNTNFRNIKRDINRIEKRNTSNYKNNKSNLINSEYVVDVYDSVFIDVINERLVKKIYRYYDDYTTYPNLWKKYLSNIQNKVSIDYTSFIEIMNKYQKIILSDNSVDFDNKIQKLEPIFAFYNSVIKKYVKNYIDLPKEYKQENQCHDVIIDIITHIVKRIILVPFYYELVAHLQSFLEETFKHKDNLSDTQRIETILNEILGDEQNATSSSKLTEYVFQYMPLLLVKKTLNIYEGDEDIDKNDISVEVIFNNLLKIFETNTTVNISGDNTLSKNIRDKVISKYKEYIEISINTLYLLMNNYLYFIFNQTIDIQILSLLLNNKQ